MAGASSEPQHCWGLERVPRDFEGPTYILQNAQEEISVGRNRKSNVKVCDGPNVSRNHLKLVRSGDGTDWRSVRWMVKDLGGQNGTFVNRVKREAHTKYVLNADDLLGVGTPEAASTLNKEIQQGEGWKKKETFVYRVKAPSAFLSGAAAHLAAEGEEFLDHDAPTPPPVDIESDQEEDRPGLPDVVQSSQEAARMRSPSPSKLLVPLQEPLVEPLPNQPPSPLSGSSSVQLKFGRRCQPVDETADCITLSSDEDEGVKDVNRTTAAGGGVKLEVNALQDEKTTPKKRGRDSSSDETLEKSKVRKDKKSKAVRLFDSDSSDDENLKLLKAASLPKSPSQGSLAQQVRKLLPCKEVRVDMKSLGMPQGCQVNGAVVSPGDSVVNWVKGRKGGEGSATLAKPKAKRLRLLEALESISDEEEEVAAAPKKPQTGRRSGGSPRKGRSSNETAEEDESENSKGGGSSLKKLETVVNDEQREQSKKQSVQVEKEPMNDEVAQVRPGPKLTPEVAAKWRAVGATNGPKLQGVSKPQGAVGLGKPVKALTTTDSFVEGVVSTKVLPTPSVARESENLVTISPSSSVVKQEPVQLDYSQVGEEEVITLDDSEEEDNYELNYSQVVSNNSNLDDEIDDLLTDSPVPSPDLEHCTSPEQSDEDSDVEILEILNNSQTALFAKVFAKVHKVEPDVKIKTQEEEMGDFESQSLLEEEEEEDVEMESNKEEPEAGLISRALQEVSGCDENMVRGAVRKVRVREGQLNPVEESSVMALVREEVEEAMVVRVAKLVEGMTEVKVNICLLKLKERKEGEVTEIMLLEAARDQREEELMQKMKDDDPLYTEERVREAMKAIGEDLLTLEILPEVQKQLKQSEQGEDELITEAIEAERVEMEEKAMNLSKVFNVSLEVAKEKLEAAGLNVELASQNLLEVDQGDVTYGVDDEDGLDDLDLEDLARSNSPELMDMEEGNKESSGAKAKMAVDTSFDVNDLLEGLSDEDEPPAAKIRPPAVTQQAPSLSSHLMSLITTTAPASTSSAAAAVKRIPTQAEKDKASFKNQVAPLPTSRAKMIEAPTMPQRHAFLRGVSFPSGSAAAASPNLSKEDKAERRKAKLKEVAEGSKKLTVPTSVAREEEEAVPMLRAASNKTNKTQALLAAMKDDSTPTRQPKKLPSVKPPPRRSIANYGAPALPSPSLKPPQTSKSQKPGSGFLSEVAMLDSKSGSKKTKQVYVEPVDPAKKEKYQMTRDGYRAVKKMSVSNVDYNVMSQDVANMQVTAEPLRFEGIVPKKKGKCLKLRWVDKELGAPLVEIRWIEADNKGRKANDSKGDLQAGAAARNLKHAAQKLQKENKDLLSGKEIKVDEVLKKVLSWNCRWLEEQKKQVQAPDVSGGSWPVVPLTADFVSGEHYVRMFVPLMLHELWAMISQEVEKRGQRREIAPVMVMEVVPEINKPYNQVRCFSLLTEREVRQDLGADGTLVKLDLRYSRGPGGAAEIRPVFGLVQTVKKVPFNKSAPVGLMDRAAIQRLEDAYRKNPRSGALAHMATYMLRVKQNLPGQDGEESLRLQTDRHCYMEVMARVKQELRKFEALMGVPTCKLAKQLITPATFPQAFLPPAGSEHLNPKIKDLPSLSGLNPSQRRVIVSVTRAVMENPLEPKLSLVQGPPGTGKSSTITGLILQVLYSRAVSPDSMPRVLVVAPSNAAVDELARKLIIVQRSIKEAGKIPSFRMVRLGILKSVHPEVKEYTFDRMVEVMVDTDMRKNQMSASLEKDLRKKQEQANQLANAQEVAEKEGNSDLAAKLGRDVAEKTRQVNKIKAQLKNPQVDPRSQIQMRKQAEEKVMAGADILLSTLSSSTSREVERLLMPGSLAGTSRQTGLLRPVQVCIMDEASQCVEPEALIPVRLGFCKLVMVGDKEQLAATVTSRVAKEKDYHQSLFNRLIHSLDSPTRSPVQRLDIQYRMHAAIANWPARYFYGGRLENGPQDRQSPLQPYTVLDLESQENQSGGQCCNDSEVDLVVKVLQEIQGIGSKNLTSGVITFYAKQKQQLALALQTARLPQVLVNTVDGFQGGERDVIVISCVRAGTPSIGFLQEKERLNVALTRARFCLVVIGHMGTLEKASPDLWGELVTDAKKRDRLLKVTSSTNLREVLRAR